MICCRYSIKQKRIINEYTLTTKAVFSDTQAKYQTGGYHALLRLVKNDSLKNASDFHTQLSLESLLVFFSCRFFNVDANEYFQGIITCYFHKKL